MSGALRSMLFTPGNRPDLVEKAFASGTDAVIVDLEDAVPLAAKEQARAHLAALPESGVAVYVRVNGAETGLIWNDIAAAAPLFPAGIVVPKAEDPGLIRMIDGALTAFEAQAGREPGGTGIVPLLESARGVLATREICESSPRVRSVLFGSGEQGDLVADLGCEWTPDGTALLTARGLVMLGARAAGVAAPMDAVFMDFRNADALRVECELAKRMGFVGKVAIHPGQLPVIHEVFTPTAEEVAAHQRILAEFDKALAAGSASISVDGRMVDYAVARQARAVLERAGLSGTGAGRNP